VNGARPVKLVAMREIREGLRNRTYLLLFGLSLAIIVALTVIPTLLQSDDTVHLGVVGPTAVAADDLIDQAELFDIDLAVEEVADTDAGERALRDGELDVLLGGDRELVVEENLDPTLRAVIAESVGQQAMVEQLAELGIGADEAAALLTGADAVSVRTLEEPAEETAFVFAFFGTILLLMGVTFFASTVLTGVVEEKSSRVVEVVLGAMRPSQLLAGKLLGISSLAFAQVTLLVIVGLVMVRITDVVELPQATGAIVAAVIGWFVLGFAFYSVVYAAAGSLASRIEDAQSSAGPIGFLLFAAYFSTFLVVLPNPEGIASVIISIVPPLAPLTMPARVALGAVTPIEMFVAVVLTIATIAGSVVLAGRVYERSVLRTERVTWTDALRRAGAR
jgi:ABC-2 type transport system permease protein